MEARVYRFEQTMEGEDAALPPGNDQALLLRVEREEELSILGDGETSIVETK